MAAPVFPPAVGRLSPIKRLRLGGEIVAAYGRVRWQLSRSDLRETVSVLRGQSGPAQSQSEAGAEEIGRRLGRATVRTLSVLPTDSRCLMRSLVLSRLLARRGIDSSLVLAVRSGDTFAAHAWVEHQGCPLLEPADGSFGRLVEI
jgi:hypothetical protein